MHSLTPAPVTHFVCPLMTVIVHSAEHTYMTYQLTVLNCLACASRFRCASTLFS